MRKRLLHRIARDMTNRLRTIEQRICTRRDAAYADGYKAARDDFVNGVLEMQRLYTWEYKEKTHEHEPTQPAA